MYLDVNGSFLLIQVSLDKLKAEGVGDSKEAAKREAAR
jgi:hypothetical protein